MLERAKEHLFKQHRDADGLVALAKKNQGSWIQKLYKLEELENNLSHWIGKDVYFSQNTFYRAPQAIENLRELRSLYVDIDFYKHNYSPDWVLGHMEMFLFKDKVPEPNMIVYSGRGFYCIWLIEPVSHRLLPLWQTIQDYLVKQFENVGVDFSASDASRVLRIAGGTHSENGQTVKVNYRHDYRYSLEEIQEDYLPDHIPNKNKFKRKEKKSSTRSKKVTSIRNTYTLHHARLLDLVKLVELRNGFMIGKREISCFLYRYWACCFVKDPDEALRQTLEFNKKFTQPLNEKEVITATKSAEKAWMKREDEHENDSSIKKGYPAAGYNYSNDHLIDLLGITPEEQTYLQTIISKKEKYRRNNYRRAERRRKKGIQTREQYLKHLQECSMDKLKKIQKIMSENPGITQKDVSKQLGISRQHVYRLLKKLES